MNTIVKHRYRMGAVFIVLCILVLTSCSDWDEFKKYTKDGEIIYPGRFDSVAIFPGKERVRIWGTLTADRSVRSARIFWNNEQDSVEFQIDGAGAGYVFDEIVNVGEGTRSFTLRTYDAHGNSSVGTIAIGVSYGDRYRNTLSNRKIKSIAYDDEATTIYWDLIDNKLGPVQMEVSYKNENGDTVVVTPATELSTTLPRLDYENDGFTYRTVFKPDLACIDTFSTEYNVRGVPTFVEKEMDRSLFSAAAFPGDAPANGGSGGIASMWDGRPLNTYNGTNFTDIASGETTPQMITVNLGPSTKLTKIVIYPFQEWWGSYYIFSTMKDFEIYGSANPSSSGDLDETWTLLTSGSIDKPSGLPKDEEDANDAAVAAAGFTFDVDPDAPKIRYIRIRCLQNYEGYYAGNSKAFFSVAEIKVFGMLPE